MNNPQVPEKNKISTSLGKKQPANRSFRDIAYVALSLLLTGLLAAFTYYAPQKNSIVSVILFASIPTIITGMALGIIQQYDQKAENYKANIEAYKQIFDNQLLRSEQLNQTARQISSNLEDLLKNAGDTLELYHPYRELLKKEPKQRSLISGFLRKGMQPVQCIWDISDNDFYDLALNGIRHCRKCQFIHHGKLSDLQQNFQYLRELRENPGIESQRIVVLSKENAKDLGNRAIVDNFLKAVDKTPSYWIDEDMFFQMTRLQRDLKLDDCALFDDQLLLFRQRKDRIAVLSFKDEDGQTCKGIIRAFEGLNTQLRYSDSKIFTMIK
jgi:hypothetical protein